MGTTIHGVNISHQQVNMNEDGGPVVSGGAMAGEKAPKMKAKETSPRNPKGLGRSLAKEAMYKQKAKLKEETSY